MYVGQNTNLSNLQVSLQTVKNQKFWNISFNIEDKRLQFLAETHYTIAVKSCKTDFLAGPSGVPADAPVGP